MDREGWEGGSREEGMEMVGRRDGDGWGWG